MKISIGCGGLEPFDSLDDLICLILNLRYRTPDPIIIYTGYTEEEIESMEYRVGNELKPVLDILKVYENIVIKFGRYIPNQNKHWDNLLGVELASPNQYAKTVGFEWCGDDDEV